MENESAGYIPELLVEKLGRQARNAAAELAKLKPCVKNDALRAMATEIKTRTAEIQEQNKKDLDAGEQAGLSAAMLDRLELTDKRIQDMVDALYQVAELDDPVGSIFDMKTRPNGLQIGRMRVPIGVIGIIYESRPNVTVDAGALCVKSGNAVILRGGKEAIHSNKMLAKIMAEAGTQAGLPAHSVQLVPTTDREVVSALIKGHEWLDLIIPRGGKSLIERVVKGATVPVIKHYDGICHVYVDKFADLKMAEDIVFNAKVQRPGVCNSLENLVVHREVAEGLLPKLLKRLQDAGVEIRGDEIIVNNYGCSPADDEDWRTEYLDLILSVRIADSFDAAVQFINDHSSQHTESIVTENYDCAMRFLREIDSACVFVNASTRFSDGGQFGMGCEIGISTDKLHARGPMGLVELTTVKFIAFGDGQIRE